MLGKRGIPGRSSSKGKDMAKSNGARFNKTQIMENGAAAGDGEMNNIVFPYFRPADNAECLPCYSSILSRSRDEGIEMKDLDQFQQELEKLLSASAVRSRLLSSEFELIGKDIEKIVKKLKFSDKSPLPKKMKTEEKLKVTKEVKTSLKLAKKCDEVPKFESPKMVLPKNDTKSKFWLSVDPYCSTVSRDDVAFVDHLIEECNQEVIMNIPEIGQHYADEWNSKMKEESNGVSTPDGSDEKNISGESYTNSVIYRLASALLEENGNKIPGFQDKLKDMSIKPSNNHGVCFDKRLKSELMDLGLLDDAEDDTKAKDDEIVQEIKLCQQELSALNDHNRRELNRLRNLVINKDFARQEVVKKLEQVDHKVLEVYNKLLSAPPADKNQIEWEAVKVIQMQKQLHDEALQITTQILQ